jgi:alpha,alpha-trehalase
MDEIDLYGFIPNGGRKYYLNRSQPAVFIHVRNTIRDGFALPTYTNSYQMLAAYVKRTGDASVLKRGIPMAQKELSWWEDNRSTVVHASTNKTYQLFRYAVNNSAPRPEVRGAQAVEASCAC